MEFSADTVRRERSIGTKEGPTFNVQVPAPYTSGHVVTEGEASALNQILAENVSNNLRAKLIGGLTEGEGEAVTSREFTPEEAQALVDEYLAGYEMGVRSVGERAAPKDPVESEMRKIARQSASDLVKAKGFKVKDVALDEIIDAILANEDNEKVIREQAKKVVAARNKAKDTAGGLDLTSIAV